MVSADNLPHKCILVTGGAGFIGSHLCRKLLTQGYQVLAVDSLDDFYAPSIKERNLCDLITHPNFQLLKTDIRNANSMRKLFTENEVHAVVHLAALAGVQPSIQNPIPYHETNVMGTAILLELCREFHVDKLVFASSSSVYGNAVQAPFSEAFTVDHPISPYAATKKTGELMCHTWHHLHRMSIICLRFFTVYGPGQRPDLAISRFIDSIYRDQPVSMYGDGSSSRDYTYIDDIIWGLMAALQYVLNAESVFEIINLGNSNPIKLKDMISTIASTLGKQARVIQKQMLPGDVLTTFADITKAGELLGYVPATSFSEGVKKQTAWYLKMQNDHRA